MLPQGIPASLSFPTGNHWKESTPSMSQGLGSVNGHTENHLGNCESGGHPEGDILGTSRNQLQLLEEPLRGKLCSPQKMS